MSSNSSDLMERVQAQNKRLNLLLEALEAQTEKTRNLEQRVSDLESSVTDPEVSVSEPLETLEDLDQKEFLMRYSDSDEVGIGEHFPPILNPSDLDREDNLGAITFTNVEMVIVKPKSK